MNKLIALFLYYTGRKCSCSTFIDEESITAGYGKLDNIGLFKYPLPKFIIIKMWGCTKWCDLRPGYHPLSLRKRIYQRLVELKIIIYIKIRIWKLTIFK